MYKKLSASIVLLLISIALTAKPESKFTATISDVRFDLQNVKSIGEELRFYFIITNTAEEDKELIIRANEHILFDGKGNEYSSDKLIVGNDSEFKGSSFVKKVFIKDIPVKACFIFNQNNVSELTMVKLLQIKINKTHFRLNDIPVQEKTSDKNTIEIENNVFLKITEIKVEGNNLRLYFMVENKDNRDIELTLRANSQRIIDDSGTVYNSNILEFASNQRKSSSFIKSNLVQDIPVKGYFEFPDAAKAEKVMLFEMNAFQNNFRLKSLN